LSSDTLNKAVQLLSRRDHSREELRKKLIRKHPSNRVEEVLDRLEELGYLDDERFARQRAGHLRTRRNWGNLRIEHDLLRLGVDAKIVQSIMGRLEKKSPEAEGLKRAVSGRKKISGAPETAVDLKKLFDYCLRLGYPPDLIRRELEPDFKSIRRESSEKI